MTELRPAENFLFLPKLYDLFKNSILGSYGDIVDYLDVYVKNTDTYNIFYLDSARDILLKFEYSFTMKNLILAITLSLLSLNLGAELIAHRGIHQTYNRNGLNNETCTASRIDKPKHQYLENTLVSIEAAFNQFADIVELDVHPTTESHGPENLVVFHDWTLNCRTNVSCSSGCNCNSKNECETNKQSLSFLQSLDIGHGYTFDQSKSFPFRGKYWGMMPSFKEVLDLLQKYPKKSLLVNVKGNKLRTAKAFVSLVSKYPLDLRKRIHFPHRYGLEVELKKLGVLDEISQANKKCIFTYLKVGWKGVFPKECHGIEMMIPIRETLERFLGRPGRLFKFKMVLWGWPHRFIELAHKHGTKVYASQVDSIREYNKMRKLNLDGIMTNKIEVIGPYSQTIY